MARLIDADALHKALFAKQKWVVRYGDKHNEGYTSDQVHFAIDDAPTVDPVKHGHWIESKGGDFIGYPIYECSECGCPVGEEASNYCPYCGAKMDEVET